MTTLPRSLPSLKLIAVLAACLCWAGQTGTAAPITIDTVPVGNLGNSADTTGFGAVPYAYNIGTTEVTNAQYSAFLNAKAASDPLGLYNTNMATGFGGITRSGISGAFTYTSISGRENMPVNFVSWYDAIRFANWLHNGQGTGDTESGAYTVLGGTATPSNGNSITRSAGALWWLTSEDEWYKAAYHKNDGDTGNYFAFPTSNDTAPTGEPPAGGSNSANYEYFPVTDFTSAGAYVNSDSPYGTFDQAGNVEEWTEDLISSSFRARRGGSFSHFATNLAASHQSSGNPTFENYFMGFRVATVATTLVGDISGDGEVDIGDFTLWADAFGNTGMGLPEDLSEDNEVDIGDFTIWADNFGNTLGAGGAAESANAVPEPSALTLLCIGMLAVAGYSWHRRRIV